MENHPEDEIAWKFGKEYIHPALDYVDGVVYTCHWLPTRDNKEKCYIITSDRGFYILGENELPFSISVKPQRIKAKWSLKSIEQFKNGESCVVSLSDVFSKFRELREFYMDYPIQEYYDLLALWDLGTYFHQFFTAYPQIYYNAIKRAGKSKSLEISNQLGFNAKWILDPTASTMFRLSHSNRCTILVDEIKHLHPKTEQNLKQMIRGKFQKGITVPRSEESVRKGRFEVVEHELYSPLAMANIKGLESDLEDRVISLTLRRTTDKTKGNREIDPLDLKWEGARDMAYLCLMQNPHIVAYYIELFDRTMEGAATNENLVDTGRYLLKKETVNYYDVEYTETTCPENSVYLPLPSTTLMSRDLLAWKPLLVLARLVSEDLFNKILKFAEDSCAKKASEDVAEDFDVQVVKALLELTTQPKIEEFGVKVEAGRGYFQVFKITEHLRDRYFNGADWVDSQQVGYALKRIDVYDNKRIVHGRTEVLLNFKKLDAYARSVPLDPSLVRDEYLQELGRLVEKEASIGGVSR